MFSAVECPPDVTRDDAPLVVVTVRHVSGPDEQGALASAATDARAKGVWPPGLLSWSLFAGTDGDALLAYEQWTGDAVLDAALGDAGTEAEYGYVAGIPGTEPSAPVRYRLHRSNVSDPARPPAGCIVTPVFDTDGPERQRHFVDEIFTMTEGLDPQPGAIAAHFHASIDGTRVLNWAEWADEQSHLDALAAADPRQVRQRVSGQIPGVRPSGYRRWHLTAAFAAR